MTRNRRENSHPFLPIIVLKTEILKTSKISQFLSFCQQTLTDILHEESH